MDKDQKNTGAEGYVAVEEMTALKEGFLTRTGRFLKKHAVGVIVGTILLVTGAVMLVKKVSDSGSIDGGLGTDEFSLEESKEITEL